jgi:hypothetical protein
LLLVIVLVSGMVAVSPFALRALSPQSRDWEQLSWIGQTYGAASALLSMFALIGITASLVMQARESKAAREQALRVIHTELLQMAMEDEVYRRSWGPFFAAGDATAQREHMYVNLIISNLQLRYELNAISEEHLRVMARTIFSGEVGARFWAEGREMRLRSVGSRRERRFHEILDEEYRHALEEPAQPPPPARPQDRAPARHPRRIWPVLLGVAGASAAAVPLLRHFIRRRGA